MAAAGRRDSRHGVRRPLAPAIHRATNLDMIEIAGETAVAHKKFDGSIKLADGSADVLELADALFLPPGWPAAGRSAGFVGYMAYR